MNDSYIQNIQLIKQAFSEEKSIELKQFLKKEEFDELKLQVSKLKFKKDELITSHCYSKANVKIDPKIVEYIESIIKKKIKSFEAWSFSWKDYSVVNDKYLEKKGIDIIIDLTSDWNNNFGGSIHYIDGTGDFTKIFVEANKLVIFTREKNTHRFVKYVNSNANNRKRVFIIGRVN